MKKHAPCMTKIAFSNVKVITGGQYPGVKGLWRGEGGICYIL